MVNTQVGLSEVALLDPAVGTKNLGDLIISEAVRLQLASANISVIGQRSTRQSIDFDWVNNIRSSTPIVIAGTNLLNSDMPFRRWWRVNLVSGRRLNHRVVLCGVGWWQYQGRPNVYTRVLLRSALSSTIVNSVRDSYTAQKLARENIPTIMTSCPTVWGLSDSPETTGDSDTVVCTITDYNKDKAADTFLVQTLTKNYKNVLFWPQGQQDVPYIQSIDSQAKFLQNTVSDLDGALRAGAHYVGTRLHAGIRSLQHGRRTTIIGVDNRAVEIGKDINLPVLRRTKIHELEQFLGHDPVRLNIPRDAITNWLNQLTRSSEA